MNNQSNMFKTLIGGIIPLFAFILTGEVPAQTWEEPATTGGPPDARILHTSVYNPDTNRMIIFGGSNTAQFVYVPPSIALRNDVWVLENADGVGETPNWTQLIPNGVSGSPSKRVWAGIVYDPTTNRLTMFGGQPALGSCYGSVNDVWVLENADGLGGISTWTQLIPNGAPGSPGPRAGHTVIYDPSSNRMILFGGSPPGCSATPTNDLWVLENANGLGGTPHWIQVTATGNPPGAAWHTAVYDQGNNRMITTIHNRDSGYLDVWVLENANGTGISNWVQIIPTGGPPTNQQNNTAVYDPASNRMIIFGGCCNLGPEPGFGLNDVWILENANGLGGTPNWMQIFPVADPVTGELLLPIPRDGHTAVYNPLTNRMIVFGGRGCITGGPCTNGSIEYATFNDVWVLTEANGSISPSDATQNLIDDVYSLGLPKGVRTSLTGPLHQATAILEDYVPLNDRAACGKLGAFINQIKAKGKGGKLGATEADYLRQSAEDIKASLGCL